MRKKLIQIITVALVFGIVWFFARNVAENVGRQGIATGFGFLQSTAGFAIIQTLIPYSEASSYGRAFVVGLLNTALVSALAIVFSTILGAALGIGRLSNNWLVARLAGLYVEVIRNVPLLLQIFFWYFVVLRSLPVPRQSYAYLGSIYLNNRGIFLPAVIFTPYGRLTLITATLATIMLAWAAKTRGGPLAASKGCHRALKFLAIALGLGVLCSLAIGGLPFSLRPPELRGFNFTGGTVVLPELAALLMGLTCYTAAFVAEIVRAGILGIGRGQREAAYSLGLSPAATMRLIILPQAVRIITPPLTSQFLNVVKNSSLAAAIGYPDLVAVFSGTVLNQTGQAVEVIFITMLVYLAASLGISLFMNWYHSQAKWVEP